MVVFDIDRFFKRIVSYVVFNSGYGIVLAVCEVPGVLCGAKTGI